MQICKTVNELRVALTEAGVANDWAVSGDVQVGFVPTMGALHKGHLSLVERARAENSLVVASVFVNPVQFNNPLDLEKYPRTLEADCILLEKAGCDIVFAPSENEVYPNGKDVAFARGWTYNTATTDSNNSCSNESSTPADFGALDKVMEGAFRPGHFKGVAVVVRRLFELVKPTAAYFGRKDFQQSIIICKMVSELGLPVRIEVCPIVREFDGLAMSSRNSLLNYEERIVAPQIYRIMSEAVRIGGSVEYVRARVIAELEDYFKVDYFEIVDEETLRSIPAFWLVGCDNASDTSCNTCGKSTAVACVAVTLNNIRLIDNITVPLYLGANTAKCEGSCR
jgi:pantoate--beta-alanine ligase